MLTTALNTPSIHAVWLPQCKLKFNGDKALEDYLARQYLFAPIWKYVLNVTEVRLRRGCENRSSTSTKASRRSFSPTAPSPARMTRTRSAASVARRTVLLSFQHICNA